MGRYDDILLVLKELSEDSLVDLTDKGFRIFVEPVAKYYGLERGYTIKIESDKEFLVNDILDPLLTFLEFLYSIKYISISIFKSFTYFIETYTVTLPIKEKIACVF